MPYHDSWKVLVVFDRDWYAALVRSRRTKLHEPELKPEAPIESEKTLNRESVPCFISKRVRNSF